MIAHNTIKARKTRSQVARLQKKIADLNAQIAILQEDKEKYRSEKDRLATQLRRAQSPENRQCKSCEILETSLAHCRIDLANQDVEIAKQRILVNNWKKLFYVLLIAAFGQLILSHLS